MMTVREAMRERQRARDYWDGLDREQRAALGDALVLGTLDALDWFACGGRPSRAFLDELERQRMLWEAGA